MESADGERRRGIPGSEDDDDDDDDEPRLSTHALAALREFYAEQGEKEAAGDVGAQAEHEDPPENWQLSQFWYTEETATALAREAVEAAGPQGRVACVCAPSVFRALLRLRKSEPAAAFPENSHCSSSLPREPTQTSDAPEGPRVAAARDVLLEFDERFAALAGDSFVRYDYRRPLDLAGARGDGGGSGSSSSRSSSPLLDEHGFSLVLLDPPYLSAECLEKVAVTARFLARDRIVLCTGAVMSDVAARELGVHPCRFVPRHQHRLANEFLCFANYPLALDGHGANAGGPGGHAATRTPPH
uniref:EEF1A lysine methyltransferase 1 n=1 Tax=Petromyzon marinus TaxID=7757 RepID=A0AAJ7XGE6_PETMA|nr:EEF1A lysine methyltransferase 1 [Petromyzon marinus]XP_032833483.1 EEF1A lysine methyltransferase 1 [Petromyzon marinus]